MKEPVSQRPVQLEDKTVNSAATHSSEQTIEVFKKYVIPNYGRYPICLVRGEGTSVWDAEGREYLDLFPGWGCNILGYSPAPVVQAIQEQCHFDPGELRVVIVESQPLFGSSMAWTLADAATGIVEEGKSEIAPLRELQPWPTGEHAEAYLPS